jgi:hypothetical protein
MPAEQDKMKGQVGLLSEGVIALVQIECSRQPGDPARTPGASTGCSLRRRCFRNIPSLNFSIMSGLHCFGKGCHQCVCPLFELSWSQRQGYPNRSLKNRSPYSSTYETSTMPLINRSKAKP